MSTSITQKEINEHGKSIKGILENMDEIKKTIKDVFKEYEPKELIFIGCGSSYYLAQSAAFLFSKYNDIPAKAVTCSEIYFNPKAYITDQSTLVLPITRRSDTSEVKMAVNRVREIDNVKTLSITCDPKSDEYNDAYILSPAAKEESVVMTKSYTSMLFLSAIISLVVAGKEEELKDLERLPEVFEKNKESIEEKSKDFVEKYPDTDLIIALGQGYYTGIALEAMNKIKEMSLNNSEAYNSLEYRHGPMSLVDENTMIIFHVGEQTESFEIQLAKEMQEKGAKILLVGNSISEKGKELTDDVIEICDENELLSAFVLTMVGQFVGLYAAKLKDLSVDKPRHLTQAIILED